MTKRKVYISLILTVVIALLAIAAIFFVCVPNAPIKNADNLEIINVSRITDAKYTEITDEVNLTELKALLPMLRAQRIPTISAPTQTADHMYEIDCIYENKPLHIIIGKPEVSCVYSDSNAGMCRIENVQSWVTLMKMLDKGEK